MENLDSSPNHPFPAGSAGLLANTVNRRCIALLHEMIEHKKKTRMWEDGFYPISSGSTIRIGRPSLISIEVQTLIEVGLVSHVATCSNPNIPDDVLRILDDNIPEAERLITQYLQGLVSANP